MKTVIFCVPPGTRHREAMPETWDCQMRQCRVLCELHAFRIEEYETELFRRQKSGKTADDAVEQIRLTLSACAADEQMWQSRKVDDQFLVLRSHAEINRQQHPLLIFRIEGFRPNVGEIHQLVPSKRISQ